MIIKETLVNMTALSPLITEAIERGIDVKLKVTGDSMYPLLHDRVDNILLTKHGKLGLLDVPLYKRENGQYVLHRIVKISNGIYFTAGDNETEVEYPVYKEQIIAVLKGIYRGDKYISCSSFPYRFYSFVWALVLPFRHTIIRFYKAVRRR